MIRLGGASPRRVCTCGPSGTRGSHNVDPHCPLDGWEEALVPPDLGLWLFARLATHWAKPRALRRGRQEPLGGLGLTHADQLEVARITLELAKSKTTQPRRVR